MQQQVLSGMDIRNLAERIVEQSKDVNVDLQSVIEEILRKYIMIPKYKIAEAEGPVTIEFGPTPAFKED